MRSDNLEEIKSAIQELKRFRPQDIEQNEYLDRVLAEILETYGFSICITCNEITGNMWIKEDQCNVCRDRALKLQENDDWEFRHRHD